MSEPIPAPLVSPPGLQPFGETESAGICIDGVCFVPNDSDAPTEPDPKPTAAPPAEESAPR